MKIHQFKILSYALLPDHFHWLMKMPETKPDFSLPLGRIKRNFSMALKRERSETAPFHVWQELFWDHVIRDEVDLERHIDYIHYNPVKHGFTNDPGEWKESSFLEWVSRGYYSQNWGIQEAPELISGMNVE